ncbi:hypothetical protein OHU34_15355 [Streptomyces sp. NBC_00080]|uniref:hypothetical protein n=1 Tax=Streptomyces TaxID=1883 RepID=UPI001359D429|nr:MULTISPECIES: hypothetical protein [Streptomyces]
MSRPSRELRTTVDTAGENLFVAVPRIDQTDPTGKGGRMPSHEVTADDTPRDGRDR